MKNDNWLYKVFLLTFFLSALFTCVTSVITNNFNNIALFIILIIVIAIGIIFDMIGVAVLTSNEVTFHAKATKKIPGSKESLNLIKNSVKISSICNDVIGDICGIVSGGLSTVLTINICNNFDLSPIVTTIIITATVSSLTVGGKAVFKAIAHKKCDDITFCVGKILNILHIKLK
ncbi:MAG: hypothetical protein ACI31M_02710 [Bacilli bacterium]